MDIHPSTEFKTFKEYLNMSRAQLKEQAKKQLGGNIFSHQWLFFVLVMVIIGVILGVCSGLSWLVIGAIALLVVTGPLTYATALISAKLAKGGNEVSVNDTFAGFTNGRFGQTFLLGLMWEIFICLWSLLFIIPGIIKYYAYSMAFYIYNDDNSKTWSQCLKESQELTKGHKWELFVLDLSFIGWMIVGSFVFGIGTLWVGVYQRQTLANFYYALKGPEVTVDATAEVKEEAVAEEPAAEEPKAE